MAKRTPEQILAAIDAWDDDDRGEDEAIEDDGLDAEAERVLAMTDEERERELLAAGVDVAREKENAVAWRRKAERGELPEIAGLGAPEASAVVASVAPAAPAAGASVVPLRPRGRRGVPRVWMLIAASFVLGAGVLIVVQRMGSQEVASPPPPSDRIAAETRQKAFAACDAQRWDACLRGLDEARDLDPAGEGDARVRDYRRRAEEGVKGR